MLVALINCSLSVPRVSCVFAATAAAQLGQSAFPDLAVQGYATKADVNGVPVEVSQHYVLS